MPKAASSQPKTPMQMVEALHTRVTASARSYKMATVRYLMRPPLSLRAKYAAFLLDFALQSDLIQDVLGRAGERVSDPQIAALLLAHQREEKSRIQLVMSDLRRLGFSDALPERAMTSGDAALRAYCTTVSGEHPSAMLGVMLALSSTFLAIPFGALGARAVIAATASIRGSDWRAARNPTPSPARSSSGHCASDRVRCSTTARTPSPRSLPRRRLLRRPRPLRPAGPRPSGRRPGAARAL